MKINSGTAKFLSGAIATICLAQSSYASPAAVTEAAKLYQGKRYGAALTKLRSVPPNLADDMTHYYLALCHQAMSQTGQAKDEYGWVITHSRNPSLRQNATIGLQGLDKFASARTASIASSGSSAPTSAEKPTGAAAAVNGPVTVMEWYTDWCHYCKEFDPQFAAAEGKYRGKINFKRYDGDDPSNAGLKEKYAISGYPHLVYTDRNGKVLYNEGRGQFAKRLEEFAGAR